MVMSTCTELSIIFLRNFLLNNIYKIYYTSVRNSFNFFYRCHIFHKFFSNFLDMSSECKTMHTWARQIIFTLIQLSDRSSNQDTCEKIGLLTQSRWTFIEFLNVNSRKILPPESLTVHSGNYLVLIRNRSFNNYWFKIISSKLNNLILARFLSR